MGLYVTDRQDATSLSANFFFSFFLFFLIIIIIIIIYFSVLPFFIFSSLSSFYPKYANKYTEQHQLGVLGD